MLTAIGSKCKLTQLDDSIMNEEEDVLEEALIDKNNSDELFDMP